MTKQETHFLEESNAIEQVYDDDSLKQAQVAWEYLKSQGKITPGVVLKTHKILMLHQPLYGYQKGYFRDCAVFIGGREGASYHKVPKLIESWCKRINTSRDWKKCHVEYEKIHPFVDGNGRTGRMFMNWQRLNAKLPLLIIHANTPEQYDYYSWFDESNTAKLYRHLQHDFGRPRVIR